MKKVGRFISDALNALVGSLATIGFMEVMNVIISYCLGTYVRMDEFNLGVIIKDYISAGIYGYGFAWIFIYCNKISKDDNKDIIEKTKKVIIFTWIIFVAINVICGIILSDYIMALQISIIFSAMFGFALLLLYLYDKKVIDKINEKIKENKKD